MSKSKVLHYASYEAPHEGDNCEYWSNAACGPEYENVTNKTSEVTCKRCLKILKGIKFDYKSRETIEKPRPAPQGAIKLMKERWAAEGKRECPDCGLWYKSESRCPECNPMG